MAATFLVTNAASLKRVLWLPPASRVLISSPRFHQMERRKLQERMNRFLRDSGYALGLAALVAGLVFWILWVGNHWEFFVAHWLSATGLGAAACLFAGGVGRVTGFACARVRLARVIWLMASEMKNAGGNLYGIGARRAELLMRKTIS